MKNGTRATLAHAWLCTALHGLAILGSALTLNVATPVEAMDLLGASGSDTAPAVQFATSAALGRAATRSLVRPAVEQAAREHNLPAPFMLRLLGQESGFDVSAVSRAGALGIAQFMPSTAQAMGLDDPFDPLKSVSASARYLGLLRRQFGNLGLAAAAYNAGPGRVQQWLAGQSVLPAETVAYVRSVTGRSVLDWAPAALRASLRLGAPGSATDLGSGGWESRLLGDLVRAAASPADAKPSLLSFFDLPKAGRKKALAPGRKLAGEAALCEAVSRPGAPCIAARTF